MKMKILIPEVLFIPQANSMGVPPPMEGFFPINTDTYKSKTIIFDKFEYLPNKLKGTKLFFKNGLFRAVDI